MVVADFRAPAGDSTLGPTVAEALRTDLAQSSSLNVLTRASVREILGLMQRPAESVVPFELAREIATREGAKAVLDGEIVRLGQSYVVSARLVSALDGQELATFRETAESEDELIGALGDLSRAVREKAGESLRAIRASSELERVTTPVARRRSASTSRARRWPTRPARSTADSRCWRKPWCSTPRLPWRGGRSPSCWATRTATGPAHSRPSHGVPSPRPAHRDGAAPHRGLLLHPRSPARPRPGARRLRGGHPPRLDQHQRAEQRRRRVLRQARLRACRGAVSAGGGAAAHVRRRVHEPDAGADPERAARRPSTRRWRRSGRGSPKATTSGRPTGMPRGGRGGPTAPTASRGAVFAQARTARQSIRSAGATAAVAYMHGRLAEGLRWGTQRDEAQMRANPSAASRLAFALDTAFHALQAGDPAGGRAAVQRGLARHPTDSMPPDERPWENLSWLAAGLGDAPLARLALAGYRAGPGLHVGGSGGATRVLRGRRRAGGAAVGRGGRAPARGGRETGDRRAVRHVPARPGPRPGRAERLGRSVLREVHHQPGPVSDRRRSRAGADPPAAGRAVRGGREVPAGDRSTTGGSWSCGRRRTRRCSRRWRR